MDKASTSLFIETVKLELKKQKISNRKLASMLGISSTQVDRLMKMERKISLEMALILCRLLNIPVGLAMSCYPECFFDKDEEILTSFNANISSRLERLDEKNKQRILEYIDFLLNSNVNEEIKESTNGLIRSIR